MLKQPERESRNVNDLFYEMEGRQIQKMNKVLARVELTKAEGKKQKSIHERLEEKKRDVEQKQKKERKRSHGRDCL